MTTRNLTTALLITFVLGAGVGLRRYESVRNAAVVRQLRDQLDQTKSALVDATVRLSEANKKLGFLESSKARVQVTAYALSDDFGPDPVFSNNAPARNAYAVPKHTLPTERILNVALSPKAERKLHANLNDTIVLMSRNRTRKHLARFVDRIRSHAGARPPEIGDCRPTVSAGGDVAAALPKEYLQQVLHVDRQSTQAQMLTNSVQERPRQLQRCSECRWSGVRHASRWLVLFP